MSPRTVAILVAALLLAGCASYPASWGRPLLGNSGECPKVNGVFRTQGEFRHRSDANLAMDLLVGRIGIDDRTWLAMKSVEIEIRMPDSGTVSIRASLPDGSLAGEFTLAREKKEFACEDGFLAVRRGLVAFGEGDAARSNDTFFLATSDDGFLIVKHFVSGSGVLAGESLNNWGYGWSRYPPVN